MEDFNEVVCLLCGSGYRQITTSHLRLWHGIDTYEYQRRFPSAELQCRDLREIHSRDASGRGHSEETRETLRRVNLGKTPSLETVEKIRHAAVVQMNRPKRRRQVSEVMTRLWKDPNFVAAHRAAKGKRGVSHRLWWKTLTKEEKKEFLDLSFHSAEARLRAAKANGRKGPNRPEKMLWEFLEGHYPRLFIPYWLEPIQIGRRFPDFYSGNGYRIVIETMSNPWHGSEDEQGRISEYVEEGWNCIVVWAGTAEDIIVEWPVVVKWVDNLLGGGE